MPTISASDARRLLMEAQGLLDAPTGRVTLDRLEELINRMGFVQLDSINTVDRAHHLTLYTRLDGFRPRHLDRLFVERRGLFEHWTHDSSTIPIRFFPYWKPRFERWRRRLLNHEWVKRRLGDHPRKMIRHVRERLERDGPLMSKDFQHDRGGKSGGWWDWKPQKAALEYLWWSGDVSIVKRVQFHKVYDLTERVLPEWHNHIQPNKRECMQWSCANAIDRLGVATHGEVAAFWGGVESADARAWCERAAKRGEISPVMLAAQDGLKPRPAFAVADWEDRLRRLPAAPNRSRLLSPFDPVIRDRKRLQRLFGFNYRFEAFVPEKKRVHAYYTLPILEGERFVGRVDPKFHRDTGELVIKRVWWEKGVKVTKTRRAGLEAAVNRLANQIGAERWRVRSR